MSNKLSTSTDSIPQSWVDALFAKMFMMYGNKFAEMWRDIDMDAVKATWSQELGKLSRDEIARGANALSGQEWPPTLPQFISLCKVKINALSGYYEAINGLAARERGEIGEWSHPAIFWASVKVGAFDLKNQGYAAIKGRWEAAFEEEMAKGQWAAIPEPMIALPAPEAKATKEVAERYIAETQVIKSESTAVDHKRWAKLIMERHKAGDKTLSHIQISFAKEALSNALH
jgi:hypothetical protein